MEQEKLEQRLMVSADDTMAFNNSQIEIRKVYEELKAVKSQFERENVTFMKNIFKQIHMVNDQLKSIQEILTIDLKKISSDFGDLAKVTKLKEAYEQTLPEISRRRIFV